MSCAAAAAVGRSVSAQIDPLADVGDQLAEQCSQFVGQSARHSGHQRIEPPTARGEPLDEVARPSAFCDHAVQPLAVGAQWDRRLLGQPVTQRHVVPEHEHQPDGRGEGIALTDPDTHVGAGRSDELQHRDAVVDHRGQRCGGARDRRQPAQLRPGRRVHPQRLLRCVPQRDQCRSQPVGLVLRIADEVARTRSAW